MFYSIKSIVYLLHYTAWSVVRILLLYRIGKILNNQHIALYESIELYERIALYERTALYEQFINCWQDFRTEK